MINRILDIFKSLFKDDKTVKDVLNFVITLVIIISVALLIGNVFFDNGEDDGKIIFDNDSKAIDEENLYMDEEERLSDILSRVKGVGSVKVMLTFGKDENREEIVKGVLIVAEGVEDNVIKERIINAAQSAFDIPVGRITVLESK